MMIDLSKIVENQDIKYQINGIESLTNYFTFINESVTEISVVFSLKRIYSRLITLQDILNRYSDNKFDKLRDRIDESVKIFHLVVLNYKKFSGNINDIIENFNLFLRQSVVELANLFKEEED